MMRFLPILILITVSPLVAQQSGWRTDTVSLKFAESDGFDLAPTGIGHSVRLNDSTWQFTPDSSHQFKGFSETVKYYHSLPSLFSDCVYFDLLNNAGFKVGNTSYEYPMGLTNENHRYFHALPASLRFITDTAHLYKTWQQRLSVEQVDAEDVNEYLQPFYFRKYEVTNKEYKEFVNWVRDSVVMRIMSANGYGDNFLLQDPKGPGFGDGDTLSRLYQQNSGNEETLPRLNWNQKIDWNTTDPDYRAVLDNSGLIKTDTGKFMKWVHFDVTKLNYQFMNVPSGYGKTTINIYPDTLSWLNDFTYSFNEPMANMYFWHPAYDNYPVVGLTYWQCLAFLEWKSKQLTQQFNAKGKKYKVVCALPTNAQWDMASCAYTQDGTIRTIADQYASWTDLSWFADLQLAQDDDHNGKVIIQDTSNTTNQVLNSYRIPRVVGIYSDNIYSPLGIMLTGDDRTFGDLISDGYFHTAPVTYAYSDNFRMDGKSMKQRRADLKVNERYQMHFDKQSGIDYLDGNVSEWMRDDLDSTFRPAFFKHLQLDSCPQYDQFKLIYAIQKTYYDKLPANGKLVRGSNWYDERYSNKNGKNTAGTNAKTFEDPSKAHCTVGFRYVIYITPVE